MGSELHAAELGHARARRHREGAHCNTTAHGRAAAAAFNAAQHPSTATSSKAPQSRARSPLAVLSCGRRHRKAPQSWHSGSRPASAQPQGEVCFGFTLRSTRPETANRGRDLKNRSSFSVSSSQSRAVTQLSSAAPREEWREQQQTGILASGSSF